jgi:protein TonB
MFEQASIDTRGVLKSPWAITASVAGQTLVLSAGILVSLIHTDALPRSVSITTVTAPGGPLKAAAPSVGPATPARPRTTARLFVYSTPSARLSESKSESAGLLLSSIDAGVDSSGNLGNGAIFGGFGLPGGDVRIPPPVEPVTRVPERPAAPVIRTPITVSRGVQAAKLMRQVNPAYPPLAVQAHISGTVRLAAIIGRDGAIQNLRVVSGHPLLTTAAVEAVKQWRYQPTLLNGEAVEVITQIDVNFTLSR